MNQSKNEGCSGCFSILQLWVSGVLKNFITLLKTCHSLYGVWSIFTLRRWDEMTRDDKHPPPPTNPLTFYCIQLHYNWWNMGVVLTILKWCHLVKWNPVFTHTHSLSSLSDTRQVRSTTCHPSYLSFTCLYYIFPLILKSERSIESGWWIRLPPHPLSPSSRLYFSLPKTI